MTSEHNIAKHGSAYDAANLLDTAPLDEARFWMLPALINALNRIDQLEKNERNRYTGSENP